MTSNGQPDNARAARYVLKDYMNGKLLFCYAPPNINQKEYHTWPERQKSKLENQVLPPRAVRAVKVRSLYHLIKLFSNIVPTIYYSHSSL